MRSMYTHHDPAARRSLHLELEFEADPPEPARRHVSPDRSSPAEGGAVTSLEILRVLGVRLLGSDGAIEHELSTHDGSLPPACAMALAREFEARYESEPELVKEVDEACLKMSAG
ncbi:hypothetical protein [Singulisphaera sp. PoT]|uniref:hypothetical protein n=1 Tax=Singulisphaera sp. PoT TaxID=3411797 RepID=UPI003BF485F3